MRDFHQAPQPGPMPNKLMTEGDTPAHFPYTDIVAEGVIGDATDHLLTVVPGGVSLARVYPYYNPDEHRPDYKLMAHPAKPQHRQVRKAGRP